ncbi:MAG: YfcE family phosphodiesterase [Promethearchaeota archaeon]|nr:MAG: YfcE family phosphodiesterase [Candidatus Lokiarchaeota archaeon]
MTEYFLLAIGDLHIPRRAKTVPEEILDKISELTSPNLFDYTFFTGDIIDYHNFLDFLKTKTKHDVFVVMGNMDYYAGNRDAPIYQDLHIQMEKPPQNMLNIGLTHGDQIQERGNHQQLESLANNKDCNILISGHTHQEEIFLTRNGILLLNPGSATGAWSFIASGIPSFITIKISTSTHNIKTTLFQLDKKNNEINQKSFYYTFQDNRINEKYR